MLNLGVNLKNFLIEYFGSVKVLALELGITSGAVSQWPDDLPDSAIGRIARVRPDILRAWWDKETLTTTSAQPVNPTEAL